MSSNLLKLLYGLGGLGLTAGASYIGFSRRCWHRTNPHASNKIVISSPRRIEVIPISTRCYGAIKTVVGGGPGKGAICVKSKLLCHG